MKLILKPLIVVLLWLSFVLLAFSFVMISISLLFYETLEDWRIRFENKNNN